MNIQDYEIGKGDDTCSIQTAIDDAAKTGGTVEFPPGQYHTGTIYLRSHVTIHLHAGAVWNGLPDPSAYPSIPVALGSRMDVVGWKAFLYAAHQENITIRGEGSIHPNGEADCFQTGLQNDPTRPYGLHLVGCRNVRIENVSLRNSAFWGMRFLSCDGLHLRGVRIFNHCNLNNDGIDIDGCRNVVVSDCFIDSSDDALCLKSEGADICENVVISNCVLSSFASAFKLGTGSIGGFRRITASNLVIRPSSAKRMSHELEAWGGLVGLDFASIDGGILEDVLVSNVVMDGPETPIFMKCGNRNARSESGRVWQDGPAVGVSRFRRVRIDNVTATGAGPYAACMIVGHPEHPVSDVVLSRIRLASRVAVKEPVSHEVPLYANQYPYNRMYGSPLPAFGLYARHTKGLRLDDVIFEAGEGEVRDERCFEDCI